MKKQKNSENSFTITQDKQNDSDNVEDWDIKDIKGELSSTELYEKQQQIKKINQKMRELEQEKEEIDEILNKENKLKEIYDELRNERDKFVFKIEYDDRNFYETAGRNYLTALIRGINKDIKILKYKNLQNYLYFKVQPKIVIKWFIKKINGRDNFSGFTITQIRANNFFEDI